tara:strand:+ start:249 stop:536 length:288 start_codon:yes stop_codon:yes gene_type:complete
MQVRKIVKDAFKIYELNSQFTEIDLEDGRLEKGTIEEVNEKYDDAHILSEARHKLEVNKSELDNFNFIDPDDEDYAFYYKTVRELQRFVNKWGAN